MNFVCPFFYFLNMNRIYYIKNPTIETKENRYEISWFLNDPDFDVPELFSFTISIDELREISEKIRMPFTSFIMYTVIERSVEWLLDELLGTKDDKCKYRMDVHSQFVEDNKNILKQMEEMINGQISRTA